MKRAAVAVLVLLCVGSSARVVQAQGVGVGYTDVGPVIGLGGIGSASIAIGGRFEHAFKQLPEMGNGILGIEVSADWYHWSEDFGGIGGGSFSWTYIPIGATVNYHFQLSEKKFDPFIGLGLGYQIINWSASNCPSCSQTASSSLYFIGRLGGRYFFKPNMAFYADVGAGAATLSVGLTFKLGGGSSAAP
jgi:hypothetical protein